MDIIQSLATAQAYLGMALVIIALVLRNERHQKGVFFLAAGLLLLGAVLGTRDIILITVQTVIFLAALMGVSGLPRIISSAITIFTGIAAFWFLLRADAAKNNAWALAGITGLLLIALGIALTPWRPAFAALALGGALMIVFSLAISAWPWFFLNIFFVAISGWRLFEKKPKTNPAS